MNPTNHRTLFISDLHLDENHPNITAQFFQLLQDCDNSVDALYILGDLFEVWIGDDDNNPFHQQVIAALRAATRKGLPIYFMHGNRDFLIGKKFLQATGCQCLPEETKILLYGTPVLLMHGDTLCTRDIAYLRWRKIARNPLLQKILFSLWPLSLRKKLADKMRARSMQHTKNTNLAQMDVTQEAVIQVMQKYQVDILIHGHTHRPGFFSLLLENKNATRIVLGAWHEGGNMLRWDDRGERKLLLMTDHTTIT